MLLIFSSLTHTHTLDILVSLFLSSLPIYNNQFLCDVHSLNTVPTNCWTTSNHRSAAKLARATAYWEGVVQEFVVKTRRRSAVHRRVRAGRLFD